MARLRQAHHHVVVELEHGCLAVELIALDHRKRGLPGKDRKAVLEKFPAEVKHVWSRIGTAEIATDPMGVELTATKASFQVSAGKSCNGSWPATRASNWSTLAIKFISS